MDVKSFWNSSHSQIVRFGVIRDMAPTIGKTVLDVGCGGADLYRFLTSEDETCPKRYVGIDICQEFIYCCRSMFKDEMEVGRVGFLEGTIEDVQEDFDVVVASGCFSDTGLGESARYDFLCQMISKMYQKAKSAVVFNCLSDWHTEKLDSDQYDPIKVMELCGGITRMIAFRHDYFPHDFTIAMYK